MGLEYALIGYWQIPVASKRGLSWWIWAIIFYAIVIPSPGGALASARVDLDAYSLALHTRSLLCGGY